MSKYAVAYFGRPHDLFAGDDVNRIEVEAVNAEDAIIAWNAAVDSDIGDSGDAEVYRVDDLARKTVQYYTVTPNAGYTISVWRRDA